jgi:hypothetical protein
VAEARKNGHPPPGLEKRISSRIPEWTRISTLLEVPNSC